MANPEHLAILKQGIGVWNQWRTDNPVRLILAGAELFKADLRGADFRGVRLDGADLCEANLRGADLRRASLSLADLKHADISEADLRGADLTRADLSQANLSGADMTDACLGFTTLGGVDLSEVKGLANIRHVGPSTIGIDTVHRSHGRIPEVFLRGAGIPDNFIAYINSLIGKAIEFHSCFISYSTKDQAFADGFPADLQNKGVRCWFAPHDMRGGDRIHDQIDRAIHLHDRVSLILSDHSITSKWVETEIRKALRKEKREGRRVLFPISLVPFDRIRAWDCCDSDTGEDLAVRVREYFIPDFSNWKSHDSYQRAIERLLRDLKANDIRE